MFPLKVQTQNCRINLGLWDTIIFGDHIWPLTA
jgi:hypothetical protein